MTDKMDPNPHSTPTTAWHRRLYRHTRVLQSSRKPHCPEDTSTIPHKPHTNPTQKATEIPKKPNTQPNTTVSLHAVTSLVGIQQRILWFLFEYCQRERSQMTPPITIQTVSNAIKAPKGSIKTTLARLIQKGFIQRHSMKAGRGGWSVYQIEDAVYHALLEAHPGAKTHTEPHTTHISSSRIDKNTTTSKRRQSLNTRVDAEPLAFIGFTQRHVMQILQRTDLTEAVIQESIHAFAFDLRMNHKARSLKKTPLDFFMGILFKGPYLPPHNYQELGAAPSPDTQAPVSNANAPTEAETQAAEKRQAQFEAWLTDPLNQVTIEGILSQVSASLRKVRMLREAVLRQYFDGLG